MDRPGFGSPHLLPLANQPGVKLNAFEEQQLDIAWRHLQLGCRGRQITREMPAPRRRPCEKG
jgi:hypothetical protein